MITAVDSSVLLTIGKDQPDSTAWVEFLRRHRESGPLVVCDIVIAETSSLFDEPAEVKKFLNNLNIAADIVGVEAAIMAGAIFKSYRRAGGPREHLIPDFLIGAHAQCQCHQLAATDRGFLRRYFPRLKVVAPR